MKRGRPAAFSRMRAKAAKVDTAASARFAEALLDPAQSVDDLMTLPTQRAKAGFKVHRNTVLSSLVRALAEGFPSVERLVGAEFFAAMAAEHARRSPPRHPVLLAYGTEFPDFIRDFAPANNLPYLADIARLDGLRRRAWHAADDAALDATRLVDQPADALEQQRIRLAPSVAVLHSAHPACAIWAAQNGDDTPLPGNWTAQLSLIYRPEQSIRVLEIDATLARLLDAARLRPRLGELLHDADANVTAGFGRALRDGLLAWVNAPHEARSSDLFAGFLSPIREPGTTQ